METKQSVSFALSTVSTAVTTGYAQITADLKFVEAGSVSLVSVYSKARLLQGAKELNYYGTDIFYNDLAPTPYYVLTSFRGGFEFNNNLTANKILGSQVSVTGYIGTVSGVNDRLSFNYNTGYMPRIPIPLVLENDKIGITCYFKWFWYGGFSYYDAANLLGTAEIIAEFLVTQSTD